MSIISLSQKQRKSRSLSVSSIFLQQKLRWGIIKYSTEKHIMSLWKLGFPWNPCHSLRIQSWKTLNDKSFCCLFHAVGYQVLKSSVASWPGIGVYLPWVLYCLLSSLFLKFEACFQNPAKDILLVEVSIESWGRMFYPEVSLLYNFFIFFCILKESQRITTAVAGYKNFAVVVAISYILTLF